MKFVERLKSLRSENKYTQKELAERMGISYQSLQKYEKGVNNPRVPHLMQLAIIFNVSVSYLIGETNERYSSKPANTKILSKRLKELRLEAGYTQKELAKKVGITGSGYSNYSSKKDITLPRIERLQKLAEIFNVSVSYLLGETDERPYIPKSEPTSFPERLKFIRGKNGYKQKEVAEKLGLSSPQTYSNYERGLNMPQQETLENLAELFNVTLEDLLYENDLSKSPNP